MSERIIVIGASGHGKVIADIVQAAGDEVVGYLDDDLNKQNCGMFPVLGAVCNARKYPDCKFIIAIGNNAVRKQIAAQLTFVSWYTAIHPSAVVSPSAVIGEGTVVMPNAVINAEAVVGQHCIINTGAIVEHENQIGNYAHISPRAALAGNVSVGEGTHIGVGVCVKNNLDVCGGCTVGAGAVVVKNIVEPGTYVGVPARRLK